MDPVEMQSTGILSRVAAGNVPFSRAVERHTSGKIVVFGGENELSDGSVIWTPSANVTAAVAAAAGPSGDATRLTIAGGFTTGLVGYLDIMSQDLSAQGAINILVKPDIAVAAGVLQVGVDETAAMAGTPDWMDLPAMEAGKWYYFSIAYGGAVTTRNATISIGINAVSDPGAVILDIDCIRSGALVYGVAGFANDDIADQDDIAAANLDVAILQGIVNADLIAGQTCVAEQPLYPIPGTGELTATEIILANSYPIRAIEDQATAGGRIGVRI